MADKEKDPPFEEAMKGLESVVARLESGKTSLEESIRLFEEGMKLSRICRKCLDEADQKIEVLLRKSEGVETVTEDESDLLGEE
ncbi:MAG: exodeoxyribonuclease VII small subunit [Syntrophorhabdaceae bacterium]|nr:exodeoxyribonuclease VII small subunit [Syntrophorhabdaceae bacterium]